MASTRGPGSQLTSKTEKVKNKIYQFHIFRCRLRAEVNHCDPDPVEKLNRGYMCTLLHAINCMQ